MLFQIILTIWHFVFTVNYPAFFLMHPAQFCVVSICSTCLILAFKLSTCHS